MGAGRYYPGRTQVLNIMHWNVPVQIRGDGSTHPSQMEDATPPAQARKVGPYQGRWGTYRSPSPHL